MPPNMKALLAKYHRGGMVSNRKFSSSSYSAGSNGAGGQIAWTIGRAMPFGLGYGLGVFILGDKVAEAEEDRQKFVKDAYGESSNTVDLRQKMWKF